jgi:hypothetical protein
MKHGERIREIVKNAGPRLQGIAEKDAERKPAPDKWSKKEILGHLIDSAANNHQRFVRAQLEDALVFPGYEQAGWVRAQGYAGADWMLLMDLWRVMNLHIAHIVERIPADKMSTVCRIGKSAEMTLDALIADYIRHVEHHLKQIDPAAV